MDGCGGGGMDGEGGGMDVEGEGWMGRGRDGWGGGMDGWGGGRDGCGGRNKVSASIQMFHIRVERMYTLTMQDKTRAYLNPRVDSYR